MFMIFHKHEQMTLFCRAWIRYWANTCVSLVEREIIQTQCTWAYVYVRPMHSPSIRALDEHQHQRACTGFELFLSQQDLHIYLQINNCVFTFVSEFRQINACALRFWCVKCMNPKGECTGQASKLKRKYIIWSKFLSTK